MHFGFSQYLSDQQIISILVTLINHHFNPQSNILLQHSLVNDCFNPLVIIPPLKKKIHQSKLQSYSFYIYIIKAISFIGFFLSFFLIIRQLQQDMRFEHQIFCSKFLLKSIFSYSSYFVLELIISRFLLLLFCVV